MADDIVARLRAMAARCWCAEKSQGEPVGKPFFRCESCDDQLQAADEIERLRKQNKWLASRIGALKIEKPRNQKQGEAAVNETLETEVIRLRKRIHELETKIGWYKAVNMQLRDDLAEANADFQALARTPAPTFDPLEAIVLGLRRENDARKHH